MIQSRRTKNCQMLYTDPTTIQPEAQASSVVTVNVGTPAASDSSGNLYLYFREFAFSAHRSHFYWRCKRITTVACVVQAVRGSSNFEFAYGGCHPLYFKLWSGENCKANLVGCVRVDGCLTVTDRQTRKTKSRIAVLALFTGIGLQNPLFFFFFFSLFSISLPSRDFLALHI